MFSRIWLINFILMAVVIFFGIKALGVWTEKGLPSPETESQALTGPAVRMDMKKGIQGMQRRAVSEIVYESIATMNLFSSDRKEPETEKAEQKEEEKQPPKNISKIRKEIILYGVIISDGCKSALISNLKPEPGERKSKWVKIGDSIDGLEVTDVNKESIILAEGADKFEILLFDKKKARRPEIRNQKDVKPTVIEVGSKDAQKDQIKDVPKVQIKDVPKVQTKVEPDAKAIDTMADKEGSPPDVPPGRVRIPGRITRPILRKP
ncbi:MAG TPA: hypothetical protein PLQ82_06495 [Desulfobacteraceae bacterium]|nr:hypothetical protein [Desulfobacteraceae bacterium]HPQ28111.1 hypothetical protein [Desulfobacteraceae bacterium]